MLLAVLAALSVLEATLMLPLEGGERAAVPLRANVLETRGSESRYELVGEGRALVRPLGALVASGVEDLAKGCSQKIEAANPLIGARGGAAEIALSITYTQYLCSDFFAPKEVFTEKGVVTALVRPSVTDGRPVLTLDGFEVTGLSEVARFFKIDALLRGEVERRLREVNEDPAVGRFSALLEEDGFALAGAGFHEEAGAPVLSLTILGPSDPAALKEAVYGLPGKLR